MSEKYILEKPRPTTGHHFSDIMACPQRAWLHYYGDSRYQVKDPSYLISLQLEGIEFEKTIYQKYYPNAIRIPEQLTPEKRQKLTIDAMTSGAPVILQGYLSIDDSVGVIDILEKVSQDSKSLTGYRYQVGEIKSSINLMTSHVMQTAWYTELLERVVKQKQNSSFFFLRSGERYVVNLESLKNDYEKIKFDLQNLRNNKFCPGPHLSNFCPSCHWRGICMPELIRKQHLSLVPGISRPLVNALNISNIISWKNISSNNYYLLENSGLGVDEIEKVKAAIICLEQGSPPLRQPLRSDLFDNLRIVVLEFPNLAAQRRAGEKPIASNIWFETDEGGIKQINVSSQADISSGDLNLIINKKRLTFYGGTDQKAFTQIASRSGINKLDTLDIFTILETVIHCPLPGFELEALVSYISRSKEKLLYGSSRVIAIRDVVNWIKRSI